VESGTEAPVLELYQAEWCPHSAKVRRRLTDLEIDFVARQVPREQEERDALEAATGCREIPTLVTEDGKVYSGEDAILPQLERLRQFSADQSP
jgi:glutaredoxin